MIRNDEVQAGEDVPFPGRQRKSARAADGGFAATFARHPARPRRGLLPGRRVWATIFGAAAVAAACAFGLPMLASIDFGTTDAPKATTVADRAGAYRNSVPPTISPSPVTTPTPSPTARAKSARPAVTVPKPGAAAPSRSRKMKTSSSGGRIRSAKFSTVTGLLIKNVMTGLCVDIPGYGKGKVDGPVEQHTCNGSSSDNELWDLVVNQKGAGPGGVDLFTIRNSKDNYCLDLPGYDPVTQADVTEWRCDPGPQDNQMWYLDKKAPGRFWIRSARSGSCLDVSGLHGSGGKGAKITVYPCDIKDDHLWSFF
jgi:hypothetical protein